MPNMKINGLDELDAMLTSVGKNADQVARKALYAGAGVMADRLRQAVNALPTVKSGSRPFPNHSLNVITPEDKADLANGIGIAVFREEKGAVTTRVGFDGYTRRKEKNYPRGVPLPMIARSIESGSSVRRKHAFVRITMNQAKNAVRDAILAAAEAEIKNLTGG